jgi:hypothetical protein
MLRREKEKLELVVKKERENLDWKLRNPQLPRI